MIVPENIFQKLCGTTISSVEAFKRSVNTITDTESEPIITIDRLDMCRPSTSDEPMMIGSSGNIQGAKTVSTPASIDISKKIILL